MIWQRLHRVTPHTLHAPPSSAAWQTDWRTDWKTYGQTDTAIIGNNSLHLVHSMQPNTSRTSMTSQLLYLHASITPADHAQTDRRHSLIACWSIKVVVKRSYNVHTEGIHSTLTSSIQGVADSLYRDISMYIVFIYRYRDDVDSDAGISTKDWLLTTSLHSIVIRMHSMA